MTKYDTSLDHIFSALGDSTRRAILADLATGPKTISDLAAAHDMALPSFMGHITKLQTAGLIASQKHGRVRTCALTDHAFDPANDWFARQRALWEGRLDRLESYLETLSKGPPNV